MLDSRKKLIWLMILTSLAVAGFVIYVLISLPALPESREQKLPNTTNTFSANKSSGISYSANEDFITPAIEAFGEAVSSTFSQNTGGFSNQLEETQSNSSGFQIFSAPPPTVTVTEQEIFEFGYTKEYKNVLREINQGMIDVGFLKSGEIYKLNTMADAITLQDKFADWLESLSAKSVGGGGFSAEDLALYRKSYREILPKLWKDEITAEKSFGFISSFRGSLAKRKSGEVLSWIGENIISRIIPEAAAQISISPCYREGTPNNQRGSQRSAPCCNCGFFCTSNGCTFKQNCGASGQACNIQLGCLNKVCANLPAIWDPQTRICGCHIGGGTIPPDPTPTPTPTPTPSDKKYACNSNNQCVEDASGQFTTSSCDNKCPTGLKCSADRVSAITQAMVSCVREKAAAAGLSVPQPQSNQLNQGCHTCQFPGNTDTSCKNFKNASPTKISCHYGGPSCNGTGHAADFTVSPASSANWNKLMNIVTDVVDGCGRYVRGARCENNDGINVGCDSSAATHIHANDADLCGCN